MEPLYLPMTVCQQNGESLPKKGKGAPRKTEHIMYFSFPIPHSPILHASPPSGKGKDQPSPHPQPNPTPIPFMAPHQRRPTAAAIAEDAAPLLLPSAAPPSPPRFAGAPEARPHPDLPGSRRERLAFVLGGSLTALLLLLLLLLGGGGETPIVLLPCGRERRPGPRRRGQVPPPPCPGICRGGRLPAVPPGAVRDARAVGEGGGRAEPAGLLHESRLIRS